MATPGKIQEKNHRKRPSDARVTATVIIMRFIGSNYDDLRNRLSSDFPSRVPLFNEALARSITKSQIMTLCCPTRLISVSLKQKLQTSEISSKAINQTSNKTLLGFADYSRWTLITHKPDKRSFDIVDWSHAFTFFGMKVHPTRFCLFCFSFVPHQ